MKEYDVTFAAAVEALNGARSCRVLCLADEASAVLLLSLEDECPPLLLGGEADVEVFCRMGIPGNDPLAAGLDCSHLVLASPSTGRALEASRAQGGLIPLRRAAASSARSRSDD